MLKSYVDKYLVEAGCDEAGRGCLAGPVVAAAVILPKEFKHPLLNDSKKLTERQRNTLRPIIEKESISFGTGILLPEEIDKYNILQASLKAMHLALAQLKSQPEQILIDGNRFEPYKKHTPPLYCKGRCQITEHRRSFSISKNPQRRIYAQNSKRVPKL